MKIDLNVHIERKERDNHYRYDVWCDEYPSCMSIDHLSLDSAFEVFGGELQSQLEDKE